MSKNELSREQYRWSLLGIGCSVLLFTLDLSIVNVALPTLTKDLKTDFPTIQWVVLSYLLVVATLLPGAARAGDLYDKKKLYMGGLALFTAASLLCALVPTVELLIAARALQGLGAVFVSALGIAIVTAIAPNAERGKAIGTVGGLISIGVAIGPSLGGFLIAWLSWHWIFLVNVPLGVMCLMLLQRHLPSLPPAESQRTSFDYIGLLTLASSVIALDLGMNFIQREGVGSESALKLLVGSMVLLIFLLWWETRHPSPIISLDLFRNPTFSLGLILGLTVFIVLSGSLFLMPFYLETALGYGTLKVGLLMAVAPVAAGIISPFAGIVADRLGERPVSVIGLLLLSGGCFLISGFNQEMTEWRYALAYLPFGLGIGIFQSPNNSSIMGAAPPERTGTASGLLSLSRTLGQSLGLPLTATVFVLVATQGSAHTFAIDSMGGEALVKGIEGTFRPAAFLMLGAAILAGSSLLSKTHRKPMSEPSK